MKSPEALSESILLGLLPPTGTETGKGDKVTANGHLETA
jgi:hypothetical protein